MAISTIGSSGLNQTGTNLATTSGTVGVGTATPDSRMTISGQTGSNNNVLKLIGVSNQLVIADSNEPDVGANWWYIYRNSADGKLRFYRNGADRIVFDSSGYISAPGFKNTGPIATLSASISSSSAASIVSGGSGYVFLAVTNSRYANSDSSVFTLNTGGNGGVTINKSGWVTISFIQDIRVNSGTAYIQVYLSVNGANNRNNLIAPNNGGSSYWTSIMTFYSYYASAGDVLTLFLAGGGGVAALDAGDWSYFNVLWIGGA